MRLFVWGFLSKFNGCGRHFREFGHSWKSKLISQLQFRHHLRMIRMHLFYIDIWSRTSFFSFQFTSLQGQPIMDLVIYQSLVLLPLACITHIHTHKDNKNNCDLAFFFGLVLLCNNGIPVHIFCLPLNVGG